MEKEFIDNGILNIFENGIYIPFPKNVCRFKNEDFMEDLLELLNKYHCID